MKRIIATPSVSQIQNQPVRTRLSAPFGVIVGRTAHIRPGNTFRTSRAYVFTPDGLKRVGG